ncbi:chemotaxis protein CheB [Polyangium aurulentum]|uniref:chemotaxis protein CheB n=1 Tax=Polyangium aurulentum TaxID=2567896 RepID=UPI0010AE2440|nr:chemotaxis protein CheB [Polyangium aurulentum]UQA59153.1 PAS domain S-box protein [Polyangium aurulentum]
MTDKKRRRSLDNPSTADAIAPPLDVAFFSSGSPEPVVHLPPPEPRTDWVPVVGIGASAGGLEAFTKFFRAMPDQSGVAFVLVMHLDPTHESMMAELLAKHTGMNVSQAADGMPILPDHVYIIPPNKQLTIKDGALHLTRPVERRGLRMPIDRFFHSLAEDQGERAIGVILSGTGSDGTQGIKAIKARGGLVLVQEPTDAKHDGMPRSGIATGMADHVMPVDKMPELITRYVRHPYMHLNAEDPSMSLLPGGERSVRDILVLLRLKTGVDFRPYKTATLSRRIQRRMGLKGVESLEAYHGFLREEPAEARALIKDILIGVTAFFRDPQAWKILEEEVLPDIIARKQNDEPVRVWVPGCSLGQEAYTLAILVLEALEKARKRCPVQVFATDIDPDALNEARAGIYSEDIVDELSPDRLRRFFIKHDQDYQVIRRLRDCVTFAPQNLISDPPFSKLDLVTCRNLLIYLEPSSQERAISLFHFALRDGGYLFLGSSENLGHRARLFETISKKWRVYRRIGQGRSTEIDFPHYDTYVKPTPPAPQPAAIGPADMPPRQRRLPQIAQEVILDRLVPPTLLVDRQLQILYFHGATERYLIHPRGEPSNDLFSVARRGIKTKLQQIARKALVEGQATTARAVVHDEEISRNVRLRAVPLKEPRELEGLVLITFEDEGRAEPEVIDEGSDHDHNVVALELEDELKSTREQLSVTIEELEAANEELKASNQEVMSMNEELQATNEELETVNTQLEAKVDELETLNNDLGNLLASTQIATIFLDPSFKIKRFTPSAKRLFNLILADVGRPLSNITHNLIDENMTAHVEEVLLRLTPMEEEVQDKNGAWYVRRVTPYRTEDNRIEGVVLTFIDISARKNMESELSQHRRHLEKLVAERTEELERANAQLKHEIQEREQIEQSLRARGMELTIAIEGSRGGLWSLDFDPSREGGPIPDRIYISPEIKSLLGFDESEVPASRAAWLERIVPEDIVRLQRVAEDHMAGRIPVYEVEYRMRHKDGSIRWVYSRGKIIRDALGRPLRWAGIDWDITERKLVEEDEQRQRARLEEEVHARTKELRQEVAERARAELAARESRERWRLLTEHAPVGIFQTDAQGHCTFANRRFCEIADIAPEAVVGKHWTTGLAREDMEGGVGSWLERVREAGRWSRELCYRTPQGRQTWVYGSIVPLRDSNGQIEGFLGTAIDISERKAVDEQRRHLEAQVQHAQKLESLGVLAGGIAHDFNNLLVAILGNAQIAFDELPEPSPAREPLRDIEMGARRAADLCRQLLAYSGKGRFVIQSLDLGKVVKEMTHLLEVSISKKADLRYDLAQRLPPIDADATQVQQVVMNLITNASEALGDRSGVISVSTGVMDCDRAYLRGCYLDDNLAEGRYVYLEVSDTGCGLDEETRARMFDPFFTTKFTGRGLGLAAVLGIVRGHRAAIRVDGEVDRGTCFRVLFPASAHQMKDVDPHAGQVDVHHGTGTVLVVDDEPSVLKVVKRALESIGLQILTASNGREALALFNERASEIGCVLLDLTMPDMDGDEMFGALRRVRSDVRVFLMSGYSEQEISRRFIGQGLSGFVQKPFDLQHLRAAIGGALGLGGTRTVSS